MFFNFLNKTMTEDTLSEPNKDTLSELQDDTDTLSEPSIEKDTESEPQEQIEDLLENEDEEINLPKTEEGLSNRESIIKNYSEKLAMGEIDEEDIPQWAKNDSVQKSKNITGEDKLSEMEKRLEEKFLSQINELKEVQSSKTVQEEKKQSSDLIREFAELNQLTENDFVKSHGQEFKEKRTNYMKENNMSLSKATEYALFKIAPKQSIIDAEERGEARAGFIMPTSGTPEKSSFSRKELIGHNRVLESIGVEPITPEEFKEAKDHGIL